MATRRWSAPVGGHQRLPAQLALLLSQQLRKRERFPPRQAPEERQRWQRPNGRSQGSPRSLCRRFALSPVRGHRAPAERRRVTLHQQDLQPTGERAVRRRGHRHQLSGSRCLSPLLLPQRLSSLPKVSTQAALINEVKRPQGMIRISITDASRSPSLSCHRLKPCRRPAPASLVSKMPLRASSIWSGRRQTRLLTMTW